MQRYRRGAITIGPGQCDACERVLQHGDVYLAIDEKPSDKLKEETVFIDDIECTECGNKLVNGEQYLFVLDPDGEKIYCAGDYKKKGGETFRKKNLGVLIKFIKSRDESSTLHFCSECCEKRKAGMERKEKGDKIFTFFPTRTGK
jgi:NAD-dependent dihydropyrimidine dehydrogenase PreA subunit